MKSYFLRHAQVFFFTTGQLARMPLATIMTVAIIGISLALPTGLFIALKNVQQLSGYWHRSSQISLFLKKSVSDSAAQTVANKLRRQPGIARVDYISRSAALSEFKRLSGFGAALDSLGDNPLPPVLVIQPDDSVGINPQDLQRLLAQLQAEPTVDLAQLDLAWLQRLQAFLQLTERAVILLALFLGLAVCLIIGNTIRLAVLSRRTEIEVIKLIGGTAAFIRRPFLYSGLIQGVLGALLGWFLVALGMKLLDGPIVRLAQLYGSDFTLSGLGLSAGVGLLAAGGVLGWLGARLAVGYHLNEIEPT